MALATPTFGTGILDVYSEPRPAESPGTVAQAVTANSYSDRDASARLADQAKIGLLREENLQLSRKLEDVRRQRDDLSAIVNAGVREYLEAEGGNSIAKLLTRFSEEAARLRQQRDAIEAGNAEYLVERLQAAESETRNLRREIVDTQQALLKAQTKLWKIEQQRA